jgi:predicted nucleic acid-binding protein
LLVVDTSAVVAALVARPPDRALVNRLRADGDLHAPHLLDVELLHALRRLVLSGQLSEDRAADVRTDFADLTVVRYGHAPLADRTWEVRNNLTAYDATFIALAEALNVPLVTCDARLAGAPGNSAVVELYAGAEG